MSSTLLTNWTVYYADDAAAGAGMKQIKWTGTTGTNTINQLYSALMDLFDNSSQNDYFDSIPIKAITPTQYQIGSFDAGDRQPWFIDPDSVQHLTGSGLDSAKWSRDLSTRTGSHGIYKLTRTTTNLTSSDIGRTYTTSGTATGWILHVSGNYIWVRPTDGTATHDMSGITSITANSVTDTLTSSATVTDESIYANIYTLGTIADATEMLLYQNFTALTQWWSTGHIDILVLVQDFGTIIDSGILTVYARQYTKAYDHYSLTVSSGGRTPVPLATAADSNNTTGYWTVTLSGGSSTLFTTGNYMYVGASWSTATAKAVITYVTGADVTYYLIGDLTNIANGNTVTEYDPLTAADSDGSGTAETPAATGPTTTPSSNLTVVFGASTHDIGNGSAPYSVTLDLQSTISVSQLYQRTKYLTRRGTTSDIDTGSQSVIGETYVGIGDILLPYDNQSTSFVEGETINGETSGATGIVTADHTTYLILRDVRGTFQDNENLRSGVTVRALADVASGVVTLSPIKTSPFGTFAGGKFFGARGVYLANVPGTYANNYELIDTLGTRQVPPQSISLTVSGLVAGDQVGVFQATGDNNTINKSMFTIYDAHGINSTEIRVATGPGNPIPNDTPTTGFIRVVQRDASGNITDEQKWTYTSWNNDDQASGWSTFLLSGDTGAYTYDTTDTSYVPYIDTDSSDGSPISVSLIYTADRYLTARVRQSGYLPFMSKYQLSNANLTITAVRATDSIA